MSADPTLPTETQKEQNFRVIPFLPAAVGLSPAEFAYAKLDFEGWLALCNVSTWLDQAESQADAQTQLRSA